MTVRDVRHDATVYLEQHTVHPERWIFSYIILEDLAVKERHFLTFSRGNRMCTDLSLVWAEEYLALAMVVMPFDIHLIGVAKECEVDTVRDYFIGVASTAQGGIHKLFTPKRIDDREQEMGKGEAEKIVMTT